MTASIRNSQFDRKESEIRSLFNECYDFANRNWSEYQQQAAIDLSFFLGDQWDSHDIESLKRQRRNVLVFNKVRRNIKMVTGYERRTRMSLIAQPIGDEDQFICSQINKVLLWAQTKDRTYATLSDSFEAMLKTGLNLVDLRIDYSEDSLSGNIITERVPYNGVLLDPRFTRRDLKDCEYILRRRQMSRDAVKAVLPFAADEIEDLPMSDNDGKFPYMTKFGDNRNKEVMRYDEFWERDYKMKKVLIDQNTGESRELDILEIDEEQLNIILAQFPNLAVVNKQVPTVNLHIMVNDILMFSGEEPFGLEDFSMTPVLGFWDPEYSGREGTSDFSMKLQSLVRCQRDPQVELNRRRSKALDGLDSQLNSGWIARNGAISNPKHLYQTGQGQVIWLNDDANMNDIQRIQPANLSTGDIQMAQMFDEDVSSIAGISQELLGDIGPTNNVAAETIRLRQGAALTLLQDLFDNYNTAQRVIGEKMLKLITKNFTQDKLARILNDQPLPGWQDGSVLDFDLVVEETVETPTQRQLFWQQLMQARSIGIEIPNSVLIDAMPVQNKEKIIEAVQQQEEAARKQQEIDVQQRQILNELSQSKIISDLSLAAERQGRMAADIGLARERISEMQQNQAQAGLDRAKTIKELEMLETDKLAALLAVLKSLEEQETLKNEAIVDQDTQRASAAVAATTQRIEQKAQFDEPTTPPQSMG